ncbi:hypothetical protein DMH04_53875 [Kibdelosporangium aridum]|uniref:Suppressor of fused-like domain-containing protein n=1 Tax=Kibdelosporangium aridum TaxID=2030 RepID=A0A428Y2D3_KIBAR|nr:suppressor of fused domain protein [Kibdelosporangium aridum]RSM61688.1 hypothetical protein DMH04_53875 [Kibdelosporangium aridum]
MDEAPGWSAIDSACARIYGDEKPQHWGTLLRWSLGGEDPLDGISAYTRTEPVPHWHYVSYGMSELHDKQSEDADVSGWGFEFTFRLVRRPDQAEPPIWPANLMQNLARYVIQTGNWFAPGHHIDANGPIAADRPDSLIRTLAFIRDPELGEIDTPNGAVQFLQLVGLTPDEYEAATEWHTESLLGLLQPQMPLAVTDIDRSSLLTPELAETVRAGPSRCRAGRLQQRRADGRRGRVGPDRGPDVAVRHEARRTHRSHAARQAALRLRPAGRVRPASRRFPARGRVLRRAVRRRDPDRVDPRRGP